MGGRRQRSSESTPQAADDKSVHWLPELQVLKRIQPGTHLDDWPCFTLTDATILRGDSKRLGNPLLVDLDGPFVVNGKLEIDSDEQQYLVKPYLKSQHIVIRNSTQYSMEWGSNDGGPRNTVVLWVNGEAGWYKIRPSKEYQAVYNQIHEAITLYNEIHDIYRDLEDEARKKRKGLSTLIPPVDLYPPLHEIFFKYAVAVGDGSTLRDVEQRCQKWAQFLIAHFPKETDFDWNTTQFAKWLIRSHPVLVQKLEDQKMKLLQRPRQSLPAPSDLIDLDPEIPKAEASSRSARLSQRPSEDVDMPDAPAMTAMPARPAKPAIPVVPATPAAASFSAPFPASVSQPTSTAPVSIARSSPAIMANDAPSPIVASTPGGAVTPASQHHLPQSPMAPGEVPSDPVEALVAVFEEIASERKDISKMPPTTICNQLWARCSVAKYGACPEIVKYYAVPLLSRLPARWNGSVFREWLAVVASKSRIEPQNTTVAAIPNQLRRRIKKPKSTAIGSASATPTGPRATPRVKANVGDQVISQYSGKSARLSVLKRNAADMEMEGGISDNSSSKRPRRIVLAEVDSSDEDDADEDVEAGGSAASNFGLDMPPPENAIRIVIHAEKKPSMTPTGPNGTWVCDQDDCGYVVRSAEEEEGQQEIRRHFEDHERDMARINLAKAESQRAGNANINYLLEKIVAQSKKERELEKARKKSGGGKKNGESSRSRSPPTPPPVKRRLLV